jgi:hypothetical protein
MIVYHQSLNISRINNFVSFKFSKQYRRNTDNTIAKRTGTKRQNKINKTLLRKATIEKKTGAQEE